ncbi:MAG: YceI family protein [Chloroflexota bacterium]
MAIWNIDPAHSAADFTVRHMMVTNVRGGFDVIDGQINFDPENAADSSVEVTIDVSSINTGVADRDGHLRSADFFDVENYPTLTFKSTEVNLTGDDTANVIGDLTIRDVTRSVVLQVEFLGSGQSPFGDTRAGFEGTANINREDFGLTWNQALETGGVLVGKDIKISLDVQGILVTEAQEA